MAITSTNFEVDQNWYSAISQSEPDSASFLNEMHSFLDNYLFKPEPLQLSSSALFALVRSEEQKTLTVKELGNRLRRPLTKAELEKVELATISEQTAHRHWPTEVLTKIVNQPLPEVEDWNRSSKFSAWQETSIPIKVVSTAAALLAIAGSGTLLWNKIHVSSVHENRDVAVSVQNNLPTNEETPKSPNSYSSFAPSLTDLKREESTVSTKPSLPVETTPKANKSETVLRRLVNWTRPKRSINGLQLEINSALKGKEIERPQALNRLATNSSSSKIQLLGPVGTAIENDRPTFRWSTVEGAKSYVVKLVSMKRDETVISSRPLENTYWTYPGRLERGAIYQWQVEVEQEDGTIIKTDASAKFKLLDKTTVKKITSARNLHNRSHLAMGIIYAKAGLMKEAEEELNTFLKENPDSKIGQKVLKNIESWRVNESQEEKPETIQE
jgi:hypothetical protein